MAAACCVEPEMCRPISSVRSSSRFQAQSLFMAALRTWARAASVAGSIVPGAGVSARTQIELSRAAKATAEAKRQFMALGPDTEGAMIADGDVWRRFSPRLKGFQARLNGQVPIPARDKMSTMTDYRI